MRILFLLILLGLPLLEIAVFVEVGGAIGAAMTVLLTVATAIAGASLLRHQGLGLLQETNAAMINMAHRGGEPPVLEMLEGFFIVIAGVLLLTPGFVTDGLGLLLFVPPFRRWLIATFLRHGGMFYGTPRGGGTVIDGEFTVTEDDDPSDGDGSAGPPKLR